MTSSKMLEDDANITTKFYNLYNTLGANSGEKLLKWIGESLLHFGVDKDITFGKAKEKYGTFLMITATDYGSEEVIYFNPETYPDVKILDALIATVSVPLYFAPYNVNGMILLDGGLMDNFPIEEMKKYLCHKQILGVTFVNTNKEKVKRGTPKSMMEYIKVLYAMNNNKVEKDSINNIIRVESGTVFPTDFDVEIEVRNKLYEEGVKPPRNSLKYKKIKYKIIMSS